MKKNIMYHLVGLALCITSATLISMNGRPSDSQLMPDEFKDFVMIQNKPSNATFGIRNNTNFIINYKFADAGDNRSAVVIQVLHPNQTLLLEQAPAFFSIKRTAGVGSQWSSYSNLPIADFSLNLNKPETSRKRKEGIIPIAGIGSSYINPLGWSLTLEWARP